MNKNAKVLFSVGAGFLIIAVISGIILHSPQLRLPTPDETIIAIAVMGFLIIIAAIANWDFPI